MVNSVFSMASFNTFSQGQYECIRCIVSIFKRNVLSKNILNIQTVILDPIIEPTNS